MDEAPTYLPVDEPLTIPRRRASDRRRRSDSIITRCRASLPPPPSAPRSANAAGPRRDGRPAADRPLPDGGFSSSGGAAPLAPNVYGWLRRLALQADLAGADRLLRDALADLTSSLSVVLIYAGPEGLHSLGTDDELPQDARRRSRRWRARAAHW